MRLIVSGFVLLLLAGCATSSSYNQDIYGGSQIRPMSLLKETYQQWLRVVEEKHSCGHPKVISTSGYDKQPPGIILEFWQTDICGRPRSYAVMVIPNGNGEYLFGFGEKS